MTRDPCPSRDDIQPHIFENGRCALCGAAPRIRLVTPTRERDVKTLEDAERYAEALRYAHDMPVQVWVGETLHSELEV